jgi:hypothetical protein
VVGLWVHIGRESSSNPSCLLPPHRFTGRSVSSSLRMDFPSMSAGMSRPAISRMVGARSMLRTMCGFLGTGRAAHGYPNGSAWSSLGRGAAGHGGGDCAPGPSTVPAVAPIQASPPYAHPLVLYSGMLQSAAHQTEAACLKSHHRPWASGANTSPTWFSQAGTDGPLSLSPCSSLQNILLPETHITLTSSWASLLSYY